MSEVSDKINEQVGEFLPNVYFKQIRVNKVVDEETGKGSTDISFDSGILRVEIDYVIKDYINADGETTWFYNADVVNNMRVQFVCSKSEARTQELSFLSVIKSWTSNIRKIVLRDKANIVSKHNQEAIGEQIIQLEKFLADNEFYQSRASDSPLRVIDSTTLPYLKNLVETGSQSRAAYIGSIESINSRADAHTDDITEITSYDESLSRTLITEGEDISDYFINNSNERNRFVNIQKTLLQTINIDELGDSLEHLSYFVFVYLDLDSIAATYGISLDSFGDFDDIKGDASAYNIISDSTLNSTGKIIDKRYVSKSPLPNNISSYWQSPDLEYAMQSKETVDEASTFSVREAIRNSRLKPQDIFVQIPEKYVSECYITMQEDREVNGSFFVDFRGIVTKNALFGGLVNMGLPIAKVNEIYGLCKIKEIKITRERVEELNSLNQLGSKNIEIATYEPNLSLPTTIALAGEVEGILKASDESLDNLKQISGSNFKLLGNTKPAIQSNGVRFYTFRDKSTRGLSYGKYRYTIEMTIHDGTINYLNNALKQLKKAKEIAKEYYDTASTIGGTTGFYNKKTLQFTQKLSDYYNDKPTFQRPWNETVSLYLGVLTAINPGSVTSSAVEAATSISISIRPSTGNLNAVSEYLEVLNNLIDEMEDVLGTRLQLDDEQNFTQRSASSINRGDSLSMKAKKAFKTIIDVDKTSSGYNFLNLPDKNEKGIQAYTVSDFMKRAKDEILTYWTSTEPSFSFSSEDKPFLTDLEQNKYIYFSPSRIILNKNKRNHVVRTPGGSQIFNPDTFSLVGVSSELEMGTSTAKNNILEFEGPGESEKRITIYDNYLNTFGVEIKDNKRKIHRNNTLSSDDILSKTGQVTDDEMLRQEANIDILTNEQFKRETHKVKNIELIYQAITSIFVKERRKDDKANLSVESYDLGNDQNAINKLIQQAPKDERPSYRDGMPTETSEQYASKLIPNQIKSLISDMSFAGAPEGSLRKSWKSEEIDVVNNFRYSQVFRYSYGTMCKIEYLNGFNNSTISIFGKPTWKTMDFNFLDNRLDIGDAILCRISKYSNSTLGIGLNDDNLPLYNQYFLLTKTEEEVVVIPIVSVLTDTDTTSSPIAAVLGPAPVQQDIEIVTAEVILESAPAPVQSDVLPGIQENIIMETVLTDEILSETNIMTTLITIPMMTMVGF